MSNNVQSIVVGIQQERLLNFQLLLFLILSSAVEMRTVNQLPLTPCHRPLQEVYRNLKQLELVESTRTLELTTEEEEEEDTNNTLHRLGKPLQRKDLDHQHLQFQ